MTLYNRFPKRRRINGTRLVPVGLGGIYDVVAGSVTLPQNLMINTPDVLLEDFEDALDWAAVDGSVADNAVEYKTGTQSVKMTTDPAATTTMTKVINLTGIGGFEFLEFWFYFHDTPASYTGFTIYLSSNAGFATHFSYVVTQPTRYVTWPMINEWNVYRIPIADFVNTGGESWANTMIRLRFECISAVGVVNISFDGMSVGYKRIPVVLLYHDDGYRTLYSNGAFQHMRALGLRGALYMMCHQIRKGVAANLTIPMVQEMYAAGWNISDHAYGDPVFAYGSATEAAQEYALGAAEIYIRQHLNCGGYERIHSYSSMTPPNNAATFLALATIQAFASRGGLGAADNTVTHHKAYFPPGNIQHIETFVVGVNSLATMQAKLDDVIAHGQYIAFGWDILDGADWSTATYKAFMDYIALKVSQKLCYVITPDEFYRLTLGPVTVGAPHLQPVGPFTLPAIPVDGTFEDGTMNYWEYKIDTAVRLSVAAGAAMAGTTQGLNINCAASATQCYLQKFFLLETSVTDLAIRMYFDPNSVAFMSGTGTIFNTNEEKAGWRAMTCYFTYSGGQYRLAFGAAPEGGVIGWGAAFIITDAPHYIEYRLHRASANLVADGWAECYVDGVLKDTRPNLANYNLFINQNRLQIGYVGGSATAVGDFFIDEVKMNKTGVLIGA